MLWIIIDWLYLLSVAPGPHRRESRGAPRSQNMLQVSTSRVDYRQAITAIAGQEFREQKMISIAFIYYAIHIVHCTIFEMFQHRRLYK